MKLIAELVPKTAWSKSLFQLLPDNIWNNIRENFIIENGKKCQICGETEGIMNLHEIWNYDDANHIQKLEGLILLCTMCHHIKHMGLALNLIKQGKLDDDKLTQHFCRINNCSEKEFLEHVNDSLRIWGKRSQYSWKQDFGAYEKYFSK
jgi:hypothetical protein